MKISVSNLRSLAETMTTEEIAATTGCCYATARNRLRAFNITPRYASHRIAWTDTETAVLLQGVADNLTMGQIARNLPGRTRNMCLGKWFRIRRGK